MTNQQIVIFLKLWGERFPYTDLTANLIQHLNNGTEMEYVRRFEDTYPERCKLIKEVYYDKFPIHQDIKESDIGL